MVLSARLNLYLNYSIMAATESVSGVFQIEKQMFVIFAKPLFK